MKKRGARVMVSRLARMAALIGLAACGATRVTDVWTDPGYAGGPLHQIVVFVLGTDDNVRRVAEDEFVRRLPMSTRGIASYGLIPADERGDLGKVRTRLRASGYDGAIVARLAGVAGTPGWTAGSLAQVPVSYRTLSDYYVSTQQEIERAGGVIPRTTVRVQTNVYAIASEALIWSGSSQTFDPNATRDVAGDVARVVVERLQKAGILLGS